MKAKLNLDQGVLELDGTPEEIAGYVKAVVPTTLPLFFTTPYAPPCTCGTAQLCAAHTMTFPAMLPAEVGFRSAEIGRLNPLTVTAAAGRPPTTTMPTPAFRVGHGG